MVSKTCPICDKQISQYDDYCISCGSILSGDIFCQNHTDLEAEGVCLICSKPFCTECGTEVIGKFFCKDHSNYELLENLVTVYKSEDYFKIEELKKILEKVNLHPTIVNKTEYPSFVDLNTYKNINKTDRFISNITEVIKLLVPCQEVQEAEKLIITQKIK